MQGYAAAIGDVYDTRRTCMWRLLLLGFILLSQVSETLTEREDEARRLDQMSLCVLRVAVGQKIRPTAAKGTTGTMCFGMSRKDFAPKRDNVICWGELGRLNN